MFVSDLVDKINEMIDILHEIDPAAAAEFRGGSKDLRAIRAVISEPVEVVQNLPPVRPSLPPVRPAKVRNSKNTVKMNSEQRFRSSEPLADLLKNDLKSEKLIEAIVFSEIISKPVSKKHGRRRF